ncbi:hypothetical protein KPA93_27820 [Burkholderia cenocepacia]|uniref:hypothetical protein n=1 Tax=Burkholderia cenocepacia TaxID=95486 RepID=UPI00286117CE|nr:hypothetical protein [Burkholderia cenocepacia]MDR8027028.1 hypothetical protein [Burkholderia cenocepacia]MDR8044280.1 hypothetical protein [Burkholderia cenocepacia]
MSKTLTDLAHEIYAAAQTAPGEGIEDAARRIEAILATQQPEPRDEVTEFLRGVAGQTPEKPDHWSTCGQCERNIDRAQDLLDGLAARTGAAHE